MKKCQWCGRVGTRGFCTWNNKPECVAWMACTGRSVARSKPDGLAAALRELEDSNAEVRAAAKKLEAVIDEIRKRPISPPNR